MVESVFFVLLGLLFVGLGLITILKNESITKNLYNNRRKFPDMFQKIQLPNDREISEKEKIHDRHICYFIGIFFVLFGILAIFFYDIF